MPPSSTSKGHAVARLGNIMELFAIELKQVGIENPQLDVRLLVTHTLGLDRAQLISQEEQTIDQEELDRLIGVIQRRVRHEPVARIIGHREFWSLSFGLNEATLEPRPDSETLIAAALKNIPQRDAPLRILDLGTGTGCLLLSLLSELKNATGLGVDIAPRAIEQATLNAKEISLDQRAKFQTGNWLEGIDEQFDIILSNPPYIPQKDIAGLMPEVRYFDPRCALDGGEDGLHAYRTLIPQLKRRLKPSGMAVFEVGYEQAGDVAALFYKNNFVNITPYQDLGGIERCMIAHMP